MNHPYSIENQVWVWKYSHKEPLILSLLSWGKAARSNEVLTEIPCPSLCSKLDFTDNIQIFLKRERASCLCTVWKSLPIINPTMEITRNTWISQRSEMFPSKEICSTLTQPFPNFLMWNTLRMLLNNFYFSSSKGSGTCSRRYSCLLLFSWKCR